MNIRAEDLADAISEELDIYASEVTEAVKKTVTTVAKETVKVVKQKSPGIRCLQKVVGPEENL